MRIREYIIMSKQKRIIIIKTPKKKLELVFLFTYKALDKYNSLIFLSIDELL